MNFESTQNSFKIHSNSKLRYFLLGKSISHEVQRNTVTRWQPNFPPGNQIPAPTNAGLTTKDDELFAEYPETRVTR
jgi:hypothetical protein